MEDRRIQTYISGFDEHLEGGIPARNVVLICGTPGTMKSTVAMSILYHNAVNKKLNCGYLSFEQSEEILRSQMRKFGLDLSKADPRLSIIDLASVRLALAQAGKEKDWGDVIEQIIAQSKEKLGLELLVIDSLNAFELLLGRDITRSEMFAFFEWMRHLSITVLVIAEMNPDSSRYSRNDESYLADGILHLKMAEVSDVDVQRRIRCVKMRGTKHHPGFFNLLIEGSEFEVTRTIEK